MNRNEFETELPNSEAEAETFVDSLCEWISAHQPEVKLINPFRYQDVLLAKQLLDGLLRECGEEGQAEIELCPIFSCASLKVEVDCFEVRKPEAFKNLLTLANNFECYPLTNGRMRLAFMFYEVMMTIS